MSKKNMAKVMRAYLLHRYPEYQEGQMLPCDNCGKPVLPKYENIAHVVRRSRRKDLKYDFSNLRIWCAPTDYFGKRDVSCHSLYDSGRIEAFYKKRQRGKRKGMV